VRYPLIYFAVLLYIVNAFSILADIGCGRVTTKCHNRIESFFNLIAWMRPYMICCVKVSLMGYLNRKIPAGHFYCPKKSFLGKFSRSLWPKRQKSFPNHLLALHAHNARDGRTLPSASMSCRLCARVKRVDVFFLGDCL